MRILTCNYFISKELDKEQAIKDLPPQIKFIKWLEDTEYQYVALLQKETK